MKPARHIALWLAAVIVTVAAALMPSGARAHEAHAHEHPVRAEPGNAAAPAAAGAVAALTEIRITASAVGGGRAVTTAIGQARLVCACPACAACGHAPSSCCAVGLTPCPLPGVVPPATSGRAPARDGPCLSGIVPEAQAEPPRSFA
ncbi:MAG: hypothetical protein PGN25_17015 [Methylorubrum populi]